LAVAVIVIQSAGGADDAEAAAEEAGVAIIPAAHEAPPAQPPEARSPAVQRRAAEQPAPAPTRRIAVAVRGAVEKPGLYRFEGDARVQDAVDEAGGAASEADLSDVNLAAPLIDGTTLTIPANTRDAYAARRLNPAEYTVSGWRPDSAASSGHAPATHASGEHSSSGRVNINTAGQAELEGLPGIGPALAARIIQHRAEAPFRRAEDLQHVSGIGEKRFEAVRDLILVE
jgi:competence protein ComEA